MSDDEAFVYSDDEDFDYDGAYEDEEEMDEEHTPDFKRDVLVVSLDKEAVLEKIKNECAKLTEVIGVPEQIAYALLICNNWSVTKVQELWFDNYDSLIENCGIDPEMKACVPTCETDCMVCMETYKPEELKSLGCGHFLCIPCWRQHFMAQVKGVRARCIKLTCPDLKCKRFIWPKFVLDFLNEKEKESFESELVESFVHCSSNMKWCPKAGCAYVVDSTSVPDMFDVGCDCGHKFCFVCCDETHMPATCKQVENWHKKNSAESENITWIQANTKICPKCKSPIQKNQGCNHMTCYKCRHEFCWLCLGAWTKHGNATGGYYNCHVYEKNKDKGEIREREDKQRKSKHALDLYIHHYERYNNHDKAGKLVIEKLQNMTVVWMNDLQTTHGYSCSEVEFLKEAAEELINVRHILKWT
eukprot:TRINITY_DN3690_c1_g1_i1.p1 TRINITY_DN3690_c1_g1~~TRINITY_DN3690_c1_g1_i1.p1  ORF type:complete len:415 (+),score=99.73 TRINITY_DN3690_c1_g1_i1:251-1495(+)